MNLKVSRWESEQVGLNSHALDEVSHRLTFSLSHFRVIALAHFQT
jgi:hypothetical protein